MHFDDHLPFTKAHGLGNDFVVLVDLEDDLDLSADVVRAICDRRFGIGADGVLRIGGSDNAAVFMDYRNADGSIVEMCGNGVRVVAKHVVDHQLVSGSTFGIDTRSGVRDVEVHCFSDGLVDQVTVDMGRPTESAVEQLEVDGATWDIVPVGIGNPHAILRVDDVATAAVATLGPRIETHDRFPDGVNVEFAHVASPDRVNLRVWERGVGETAACGTGACATQVALHRLGLVGDDVTIALPGGDLRIRWHEAAHGVAMTGPAVEVASGTIEGPWLRAAQHGLVPTSRLGQAVSS